MKGSYFPNEEYDFENAPDKIVLFVEMLKKRGCYIGEDGHIRGKRGGNMSKITRNGYWLTGAAYNRKDYYFCEHRVVWVWHNGAIPDGMVINHKDYNRSNNHIENLAVLHLSSFVHRIHTIDGNVGACRRIDNTIAIIDDDTARLNFRLELVERRLV